METNETREPIPEISEGVQPEKSETSEPSDLSEPSEPSDSPDIESLIAEAEERGYQRGLNERLLLEQASPVMFEDLARRQAQQPTGPMTDADDRDGDSAADDLTSRFLTRIRPGVWD